MVQRERERERERKPARTLCFRHKLSGNLQVRTIGDDCSGLTVIDDEFQFGDGKPVVEIIEHRSCRGNSDPTLQVPKAVLAD
jgi:hypothetical protein